MIESKVEYSPIVTVRVKKDKVFFGPGVYMILKELTNTSNMKEACSICGISYSKAWKIMNNAKKELGYDLITRNQGGKHGGACYVTEKGLLWMLQYEKVSNDIERYAQKVFIDTFK